MPKVGQDGAWSNDSSIETLRSEISLVQVKDPIGTNDQRADMYTKNLRVLKYEANRLMTNGW